MNHKIHLQLLYDNNVLDYNFSIKKLYMKKCIKLEHTTHSKTKKNYRSYLLSLIQRNVIALLSQTCCHGQSNLLLLI